MNYISLLFFSFVLLVSSQGQSYRATVHEDYTMTVEPIQLEPLIEFREETFQQISGFPKGAVGNPSFKNFRNVTLADLDGDMVEDILFTANNQLFAYRGDGTMLWQKSMNGVGIYPPAVADINNDGAPEIVQATGGAPEDGRVYALDHNGNDLPGWPVNFDNHWILTSPALSDLNNDTLMEIVVLERDPPAGNVHILKIDGTSFSSNWPVTLDNTPAITPSIGDVDGDGEKDIVVHSIDSRYIIGLDGQVEAGFPLVTTPAQRYSFQSPILVGFDADMTLEIVGATHAGIDGIEADPQYFVMNYDGTDRMGWPIDAPNNNWTFSTPTVVEMDGQFQIFMGGRTGETVAEMLFGWNADGEALEGFPIEKLGGNEGIISIADIDNDDEYELIFGNELLIEGGSFIHAYEMDGSGEVEDFCIKTNGWNKMNGAAIGDVDGDGMMDLTALSYTLNFGADIDSVFLNVYNLEVPYSPEKVLWSTYKGSNTRSGLVGELFPTSTIQATKTPAASLMIHPNPAGANAQLELLLTETGRYSIDLFDSNGKRWQTIPSQKLVAGRHNFQLELNNVPSGMYLIAISNKEKIIRTSKFVKK